MAIAKVRLVGREYLMDAGMTADEIDAFEGESSCLKVKCWSKEPDVLDACEQTTEKSPRSKK